MAPHLPVATAHIWRGSIILRIAWAFRTPAALWRRGSAALTPRVPVLSGVTAGRPRIHSHLLAALTAVVLTAILIRAAGWASAVKNPARTQGRHRVTPDLIHPRIPARGALTADLRALTVVPRRNIQRTVSIQHPAGLLRTPSGTASRNADSAAEAEPCTSPIRSPADISLLRIRPAEDIPEAANSVEATQAADIPVAVTRAAGITNDPWGVRQRLRRGGALGRNP
jgi:hypothetical protein